MRQVFDLVDRIVVFRRGRIVGAVERDKTDGNEIVSLITGVKSTIGGESRLSSDLRYRWY